MDSFIEMEIAKNHAVRVIRKSCLVSLEETLVSLGTLQKQSVTNLSVFSDHGLLVKGKASGDGEPFW